MLEAMGCGLPVAAYPVDGPIDVLGNTKSAVMDNDLKKACESALHISRKSARKYAETSAGRAQQRFLPPILKPV